MTKIIYIQHNGTEHIVDANDGDTLMQTALDNLVPGIVGDCGGSCSCATCHGFLDVSFAEFAGTMGEDERNILEGVLEVQDNSRLTCQIKVTPELEGLVIKLPKSQF